MTDRPDDPIKAWRERGPSLNSLVLAGDRLADALEAAQKERDELHERLSGSVEDAFDSESGLQARVRQLEEALTVIAEKHALGTWQQLAKAYERIAREVLAAKENTTP